MISNNKFTSTIKIFLTLTILHYGFVQAQLNPQKPIPPGIEEFKTVVSWTNIPADRSVKQLLEEDQANPSPDLPLRSGIAVPVYQDFFTMGEWKTNENGEKYYQVLLHSKNAKALMIAFERFYLPENGRLYFYNPDKTIVLGDYNHFDNPPGGMFPGPIIPGDKIIVEYLCNDHFEDTNNKPNLFIKELAYIYRFEDDNNIKNSGPCQVDVNCSEGALWQKEKRGVARIHFKVGDNYSTCSGTLINNTRQDGTPYFLTAFHCGGNASPEDRNFWQFRFNYEQPECNGHETPSNQTIPGCQLISLSPIDGGSDMQLLKLNFLPPPQFKPYYNGWDRSVVPPTGGVGIHHPVGDVKKISTYSSPPESLVETEVSGFQMANHSIWNIIYQETDNGHGTTEPGSSGSPLFSYNKLVVGTLTGGNSGCNNPLGNNLYGRFYHHWENNGAEDSTQLKPFLDPKNTGQIQLQGLDPYPLPAANNLQGIVNDDFSVTIDWKQPQFDQPNENWFGNVSSFSSSRNETKQRISEFDLKNVLQVDTFYLKKIAHAFWENPLFLWEGKDQFHFIVYDSDTSTVIHQSYNLSASDFHTSNQMTYYEMEEPITLTNKFFIAIIPLSTEGYPSSLAQKVPFSPSSFFGEPNNWNRYELDEDNYELTTSVFGTTSNPDDLLKNENINSIEYKELTNHELWSLYGNTNKNLISEKNTAPLIPNHIKYYNIYRDSVLIHSTENSSELFFNDTILTHDQTYYYQISVAYDLNPNNPYSPILESEKSPPLYITVKLDQTLVDDFDKSNIIAYPNPTKGKLTLELPYFFDESVIKIYNYSGKLFKINKINADNKYHQLDISDLKDGLYILKIETNNQIYTTKIILNKSQSIH